MQQCPPEASDPGYLDSLGSMKIYQTCSQENGDRQSAPWPLKKVRNHHLCKQQEDGNTPVFTDPYILSPAQYSTHKSCSINNNQMDASMLEKWCDKIII